MTTNNPLSAVDRETLNLGLGGTPGMLERAVDRIATARATAALREAAAAWSSPICCDTCMYVGQWLRDRAAALDTADTAPNDSPRLPSDPRGNVPPQYLGGGHRMGLYSDTRAPTRWDG